MFRSKFLPFTALALAILLILLVVISWIVSSVNPSLPIKSLISAEGLRWFFGGFTSCLASPLLVWILVGSVAWGAFVSSGLRKSIISIYRSVPITYRQKHALVISCGLLVLSCVIIILLALVPHAVLLGVTGKLFPSAFSSGLIPLVAFIVTIVSLSYGIACGEFNDIEQVFMSLYAGIRMSAPLWPIYIFAMQLYFAIVFVFFER